MRSGNGAKYPSQAEELKERSKRFAINIIRLFRLMPKTEEARIIGRQLLRAGTGVAANYRSTCRSRSDAEFISRIGVVVEEADETAFWLELLLAVDIDPKGLVSVHLKEANELLAIFAASQRTSKKRSLRFKKEWIND